ncbi:hypothetical protein BGZ73_007682, partial [Actinomortierella ambigua]
MEQHMHHPFKSPEKAARSPTSLIPCIATHPQAVPGAMSNKQQRHREEQQRLEHQALLSLLQDQMPQRMHTTAASTISICHQQPFCRSLPVPPPPAAVAPKMALLPSLGIPEQQTNRGSDLPSPRSGDILQKLQQLQQPPSASSSLPLPIHPTPESLPWYNGVKGCCSVGADSSNNNNNSILAGLPPPPPNSQPRRLQKRPSPSAPPLLTGSGATAITAFAQPSSLIGNLESLRPPKRAVGRARPRYPALTDPVYAAHLLSTVTPRDLQRLYVHAAHHLHSHQPIRRYVLMKCIMTQAELTQFGRLRAEMPRAPGPSTGARPKPTGFGTLANTGLEARPKQPSKLRMYVTMGRKASSVGGRCPWHRRRMHQQQQCLEGQDLCQQCLQGEEEEGEEEGEEEQGEEQEQGDLASDSGEDGVSRGPGRKRPAWSPTTTTTITTDARRKMFGDAKIKRGGRVELGRTGHEGRPSKQPRHDVDDGNQGGRTDMNVGRALKLDRIEMLDDNERKGDPSREDEGDDDEKWRGEKGQSDQHDYWTGLRRLNNKSRRRLGRSVAAEDHEEVEEEMVDPLLSSCLKPQSQPNGRHYQSLGGSSSKNRLLSAVSLSLRPMFSLTNAEPVPAPVTQLPPSKYHHHHRRHHYHHEQQQQEDSTSQSGTITIQGIVKRFLSTASLSEIKRSMTGSSAPSPCSEKVYGPAPVQVMFSSEIPTAHPIWVSTANSNIVEPSEGYIKDSLLGVYKHDASIEDSNGDEKMGDIYMGQGMATGNCSPNTAAGASGTTVALGRLEQQQHQIQEQYHHHFHQLHQSLLPESLDISKTTAMTTTATTSAADASYASGHPLLSPKHGRTRRRRFASPIHATMTMTTATSDDEANNDGDDRSTYDQDSLVQPLLPQGHFASPHPPSLQPKRKAGTPRSVHLHHHLHHHHHHGHHHPLSSLSPTSPSSPTSPFRDDTVYEQQHQQPSSLYPPPLPYAHVSPKSSMPMPMSLSSSSSSASTTMASASCPLQNLRSRSSASTASATRSLVANSSTTTTTKTSRSHLRRSRR